MRMEMKRNRKMEGSDVREKERLERRERKRKGKKRKERWKDRSKCSKIRKNKDSQFVLFSCRRSQGENKS